MCSFILSFTIYAICDRNIISKYLTPFTLILRESSFFVILITLILLILQLMLQKYPKAMRLFGFSIFVSASISGSIHVLSMWSNFFNQSQISLKQTQLVFFRYFFFQSNVPPKSVPKLLFDFYQFQPSVVHKSVDYKKAYNFLTAAHFIYYFSYSFPRLWYFVILKGFLGEITFWGSSFICKETLVSAFIFNFEHFSSSEFQLSRFQLLTDM